MKFERLYTALKDIRIKDDAKLQKAYKYAVRTIRAGGKGERSRGEERQEVFAASWHMDGREDGET